ncbi:MAG: MurT ligase domain-containing protein [Bacilli bacterium]
MRKTLAIIVCKFITFVCKLFGKNGSVYPGEKVFDFIDSKILDKIEYPKYVIAVTGSSGKGSTTNAIAKILKSNGYDVCYNQNGSNGILAAITLILNNSTLSGKFKHEVLLLECDERHLKLIFNKQKMTHLIITNITRDQPARNGHPDIVFKDIIDAIGNDTHLIINADDPLVNRLSYSHKGKITTYGINKTSESYKNPNLSVDYAYCPICHKKLVYDYYHYGHIGNYHCPNKDFLRGNVNYLGSNLDLKAKTMLINDNLVNLDKDVLYAAYYTLAAYSLCNTIGLTNENIVKVLNNNHGEAKRGKVYKVYNRDLVMLESKNENNLSYYQSIRYIVSASGKKTIILGFDNVSRRYKFNDLSWLWDVDFELLNNDSIDKIFVIGRFKYDVATRLAYANISKNKIILVDDVNKVLEIVKDQSIGTIYTMVCFDMTAKIKELIVGENE